MKNRKQAMASMWSFAIAIAIFACIFSILFASLTGREKKVKAPKTTEPVITQTQAPDTQDPEKTDETGAEDQDSTD